MAALPVTPLEPVDRILAERFHSLFAGSEVAHGKAEFPAEAAAPGEKVEPACTTLDGPLTVQHCKDHLAGRCGAGSIPIRQDNTCTWGAADIDEYQIDHSKLAAKLTSMSFPLIVCKSKSDGAHMFLFASEPVPAELMQKRLSEIAERLGYPSAEIFPKQTTVGTDENGKPLVGNWINLPYFGDNRQAINFAGDNPLSLEKFLQTAEALRQPREWFEYPLLAGSGSTKNSNKKKDKKKPFVLPNEICDGQRNKTLTSMAGKLRRDGLNTSEIFAALRSINKKRCTSPLSDKEVETIATSIGRRQPSDTNEGLTKELATAVLAAEHFARDKGGLLYATFENGVYRPTGERVIGQRVKQFCQLWAKTKSWSPELASRVCQWIAVDAPDLWERPPLDSVNCKNGLLDLTARTLRAHSPDYLSPVQIAASFDAEARCTNIERFIEDIFPSDSLHLPFEIAAWLMLPNTDIQKAVLALGEGSNGKSIWLTLLINFIGHENVSTLSLHRIEQDKFSAARLYGKLANICPDLPTRALTGTSVFKALTGGDIITGERKFESSFEFQPFARLIFSANSAPRSDDSTHGFFRRWLAIPFTRTFDETGPDTVPPGVLNARLTAPAELSGLLNRALDALPAIGRGRFTESASTKAALDEFRATTDPFAVWLDQNTVERAEAFIPKDRLRRMYTMACQEVSRPIMEKNQFTKALKRHRPKVVPGERWVNREKIEVFNGIGEITQQVEPATPISGDLGF